ncbi:hypothetical protein [Catenuloplanes atrovinosus]|uniref:Uncharacterized protein n=1 Tax=Catenuloplanes atrovinosus TaxID=137266 RepID=A0AAE4CDN3_9ACTN|nr:hypothetical protein [Catenuloplanes atrovinosus]MDR7279224.1 hypothetical protein [Catenuloplanes atrovinosus]
MRHIWSLIAGLVAAPLTWLLLATGQASSSALIAGWVAAGRGWDTHDLLEPAAFLLVAGVLLGTLGTLRISPLGPLVAGLLLIAAYVATFIDPLAVRDAIPNDWRIEGRAVPLHVPLDNGTLAVLGVMLLAAPFSVQRWRRWPLAVAAPAADTPADPDTAETADVSESNDVTMELKPVSPAAPSAPRPSPAAPLTAASVAVPGPVVESPAAKRAAGGATPSPSPSPSSPQPSPSPAAPPPSPAPRPAPGGPAPTDPDGPAPEEPPVPSARRPESPWSQPPSGSSNRTKTPG